MERKAIQLAKIYLSFYRKYSYKTFTLSTVKQSKWWKFFIQTIAEYSRLKDWDAYVWVACQFEKYGKIYPYQLYGKKALEAFNEYKETFKVDSTKVLANNLLLTFNLVKQWSKKNKYDKINFKAYLEDEDNIFKLKRGNINPYLFVVVKSFQNLDDRFDIIDKEKFMVKRAAIMSNKKIKNKMKEVLGEEFFS